MSKPRDLNKGVEKYLEFHDYDPRHVFETGIVIPEYVEYHGKMVNTKYASKKWENKTNYYTHDHDSGVKLYRPGRNADKHVPMWIQRCGTLVRLGRCIGLEFVNEDGDDCVAQGNANTDLYCTPNGNALIVVENKRRIDAIIWGGRLCVEARGICY